MIGFHKISSDDLENLIWDYQKIQGLACGHLITLEHLNSIGIKVAEACKRKTSQYILMVFICDES